MTAPTLRCLSLGAGVQSSVCLLLAAQGRIPTFDVAISSDTGWEPIAVYRHLHRLTRIAEGAGIPIVRVTGGHIRSDALDPAHRFASMPLFTLGPNGERGWPGGSAPTKEVRRRLGYPHPSRVPAEVPAEIAIGISVDEVTRARDADVAYMRNTFPLLDLRWRREDCVAYLALHGLADTPKSSCAITCPFHDDAFWARLKADSPVEWADAVAFDKAIRHGSARANADGHPLRGQFFLHASRVPLDQVVLRPRPVPAGEAPGCGPFTCPHPDPVEPAEPVGVVPAGFGREVA